MKEQFDTAIEWIKKQPVKGCITGSCLLEIFDDTHQDIDIFLYDEKSFVKMLFAMYHNPMFQILDPLEKWKFEQFINKEEKTFYKFGLVTIKFTYNTCIDINVIVKKNCTNIFSVLSSFDMDIISKGYDLETKQYLDLSTNDGTKVATWNKWNPAFYSTEIWQISRILRQLERCFKYYKRGYNVDAMVLKYIDLIEKIQEFQNIFSSENFDEKLKVTKQNTIIVKQICEVWLKTHEITDDQLELLKIKIKEI